LQVASIEDANVFPITSIDNAFRWVESSCGDLESDPIVFCLQFFVAAENMIIRHNETPFTDL
jgi:hypothetical protein